MVPRGDDPPVAPGLDRPRLDALKRCASLDLFSARLPAHDWSRAQKTRFERLVLRQRVRSATLICVDELHGCALENRNLRRHAQLAQRGPLRDMRISVSPVTPMSPMILNRPLSFELTVGVPDIGLSVSTA